MLFSIQLKVYLSSFLWYLRVCTSKLLNIIVHLRGTLNPKPFGKHVKYGNIYIYTHNVLRIYDKSYVITKVSTINEGQFRHWYSCMFVIDIVIGFELTLNQCNQHHLCYVHHNTNVTSHHLSLGSSALR
jgi:hypothetical protein